MKGYTVFNVEQIDGLPEHYYAKPEPRGETVQRIERAESFFAATGAERAPRRQPGLLQHQHRPCADAAHRGFPRRRELLRDPRA